MDVKKIAEYAHKYLEVDMPDLDPAERVAALRSAAVIISETLMAEGLKASMANWMKSVYDPPNRKE